ARVVPVAILLAFGPVLSAPAVLPIAARRIGAGDTGRRHGRGRRLRRAGTLRVLPRVLSRRSGTFLSLRTLWPGTFLSLGALRSSPLLPLGALRRGPLRPRRGRPVALAFSAAGSRALLLLGLVVPDPLAAVPAALLCK